MKGVFGAELKAARIAMGITLREFCLKHGLDPGNMSRIERGIAPPPVSRKAIVRWAKLMGYHEHGKRTEALIEKAITELGWRLGETFKNS